MKLSCYRYYYLNVEGGVVEYLVIVNSLNFSKKNEYVAYKGYTIESVIFIKMDSFAT